MCVGVGGGCEVWWLRGETGRWAERDGRDKAETRKVGLVRITIIDVDDEVPVVKL